MKRSDWAIIELHPNRSAQAVRNLRRQGIEVYNPVTVERFGRTLRRVQLFTNYLFVRIIDSWRAIKSTVGVKDFVRGAGSEIGFVPKSFIEELRKRENRNGVIHLPKPKRVKFEKGQKVLVKSLFLEGLYQGQQGIERCSVLFNLLGAARVVVVDEGELAAA